MLWINLGRWLGLLIVVRVYGQSSSSTSTNATTTTTTKAIASAAPTNLPPCPNSCLNDILDGTTPSGCADVTVPCICASTQGLRSMMCCVKARCSDMDQQETVSTWIDTCAGLATAPDFLNQLGCINSTSTSTTTTNTSSSSPSTKSTALPKGAGIGIGVGIGMLSLATTLLLIYYLLRRRRKKRAAINANENGANNESGKAELDGATTTVDEKRVMHELDTPVTIHEIDSANYGVPQELPGSAVPVPVVQELEGGVKGEKGVI